MWGALSGKGFHLVHVCDKPFFQSYAARGCWLQASWCFTVRGYMARRCALTVRTAVRRLGSVFGGCGAYLLTLVGYIRFALVAALSARCP